MKRTSGKPRPQRKKGKLRGDVGQERVKRQGPANPRRKERRVTILNKSEA